MHPFSSRKSFKSVNLVVAMVVFGCMNQSKRHGDDGDGDNDNDCVEQGALQEKEKRKLRRRLNTPRINQGKGDLKHY